jgi:hypothetical protein
MKDYIKKPIIIQAEQWFKNGDVPEAPIQMIDVDTEWICKECGHKASEHGNCKTLEGYHIVCPSDYIIKGIKKEFYPCKEEIFKMTYDTV